MAMKGKDFSGEDARNAIFKILNNAAVHPDRICAEVKIPKKSGIDIQISLSALLRAGFVAVNGDGKLCMTSSGREVYHSYRLSEDAKSCKMNQYRRRKQLNASKSVQACV